MRRVVKGAAGAVVAMLLLAVGAWWVLPGLIQSQLQSRGSELLGRAVTVQSVAFAPWALSLTLEGLTVAGREAGQTPQLSVGRLVVDADLRSLLRLAPVVERLEIDAPRLRLARLADGGLDIDDILERLLAAPPAEPSDGPARFALFNLQLRDGEIRLDDAVVGRQHHLQALQLALPFLSNLPDDLTVQVEPRVRFVLDGHAVAVDGRTLPFAPDRASEMTLSIDTLSLEPWWAYLPQRLALRPAGGELKTRLQLRFAQPPGQAPTVALGGQVQVSGLALRQPDGKPVLGWRALSVELIDVRPLERRMTLGRVTWDGAQADVRRRADGTLDMGPRDGGAASASPAGSGLGRDSATRVPSAALPAPTPGRTGPDAGWQVSVAEVTASDARLRWHDAVTRPQAELALDALSLKLGPLAWPSQQPWPLQASARLDAAGQPAGQLQVQGEFNDRTAALTFDAQQLRLEAAAPYLRPLLGPALSGRAAATGTLAWARGEPAGLTLDLQRLQLDALRLQPSGDRVPALQLASATLERAQVDLAARRVTLADVTVRQPQLQLQRGADGRLNVQDWFVPGPAAASPAAGHGRDGTAAADWRVSLGRLQLEGGRIGWIDEAVRDGTPVRLDLQALRLGLRGLEWPWVPRPMPLELSVQLTEPPVPGEVAPRPGRLLARGQLGLAPPAWKGRLELERAPLHVVDPYVAAWLPVQLSRAELGVAGDFDLRWTPQGPRLEARAELLLADVALLAAPGTPSAGQELMAWQSLSMRPLLVGVAPGRTPRVEIGEVLWSDFYSRLVIAEDGSFNLRDVGAGTRADASARAAAAAGTSPPTSAAMATLGASAPVPGAAASVADAPAGASITAAAAAAAAAPAGGWPVELVVGATRFANGRVDFTDRFIRPNYSAALSELNGSLGRIDSGRREMATLELRGRAAGTALLEVRGALDPTARPLALDISARATDLELAPLTPYAGKYAGYAIERGKLSMDVAYRIDPDGRLQARNQLILNQLTFGDRIDSPDATKLPVRLALALLTDRHGVIDLNLPVSGSINDPQFSVWGIVWRLIGNLLVKAVTAPFALLAGSETDELSTVAFVPGSAVLAGGAAESLQRVGRLLADRPALRLTVSGSADPVREQAAIRAALLESRIVAEQRRERARAGGAGGADSASPPLTAAQRSAIVKRLYTETRLPDRPRNLMGLLKDLPPAEMEQRLQAAMPVTADTARELAIQRGLAVRDALIAQGLPSERLFLGAPQVHEAAPPADATWAPRVQLQLQGP